jgi:biopolymer transport protein ExbD
LLRLGLKLRPTLPQPDGACLFIVPLVNLLFLLLIFFMLGSTLVLQPGIEVAPPEVDEPVKGFVDKLVITLTKENLLFFNDQRVQSTEDLAQKLDAIVNRTAAGGGKEGEAGRRRSRPPVIILKADKDAPYDDVVQIMSITRKYGARVYLVTRAVKP